MDSQTYLSSLLRLTQVTRLLTTAMKEKGQIKKIRIPYFREKLSSFEYKEGNVSWQSQTEVINKEVWVWEDIFRTVAPEIEATEDFSQSVQQISSFFKTSEAQAKFWVSRFINAIAKEVLENASEDKIMELTFSFMRDLEGSSKLWTPHIWLKGIWMVDDALHISNDIRFRKPVPSDLEREWDLRVFPYFHEGWPRTHPSAILDVSFRAINQPEVHKKLERLILTLRLFRVGSVDNVRTFWRSESILDFGATGYKSIINESYKYPLSKLDVPKLKEFVEKISPLVPENLVDPSLKEVDYSVIAIQRYNDAILKPEIIESRLSFAVMALEALYLKETEREELEHRLSQRVARLLSFFGCEPLEVYNTLKHSYDIRSSFVHGSPIPQEKLKETAKMDQKVLEYVRLSIVLFLLLKQLSEKDKFLSLIDHSLLSKNAFDKLEKMLKEYCAICQPYSSPIQ